MFFFSSLCGGQATVSAGLLRWFWAQPLSCKHLDTAEKSRLPHWLQVSGTRSCHWPRVGQRNISDWVQGDVNRSLTVGWSQRDQLLGPADPDQLLITTKVDNRSFMLLSVSLHKQAPMYGSPRRTNFMGKPKQGQISYKSEDDSAALTF